MTSSQPKTVENPSELKRELQLANKYLEAIWVTLKVIMWSVIVSALIITASIFVTGAQWR